MVIFGAVIGVVTIGAVTYDNHSDYSDYGNYSNYSDAAERAKRRRESKQREINSCADEINQYKIVEVNDYLESQRLKSQSGVEVSLTEVLRDGTQKIDWDEAAAIRKDTQKLKKEVEDIDKTLAAIDRILEETEDEDA